MKVDANYKPYYVNQESKDNNKHIQLQTKYNLLTADHIIQLIIVIKQALKNLKDEKSLEN